MCSISLWWLRSCLRRAFFGELKAAAGSIVNATSIAGPRVHPFAGSAYTTSKAALVVCIKQVPGSAQIRVPPVTNTIMRQGVPTIINPYDLFALEAALELRDRFGGEIALLTIGPMSSEDSLRKALTFGADRAILLSDRCFAGSDTLVTTYALAAAIRKVGKEHGPPDFIFTGKQTIDGDTAQVGPGIAKRLGMLRLTYVGKIRALDPTVRTIETERRAEGGVQVLPTRLLRLITILEATN